MTVSHPLLLPRSSDGASARCPSDWYTSHQIDMSSGFEFSPLYAWAILALACTSNTGNVLSLTDASPPTTGGGQTNAGAGGAATSTAGSPGAGAFSGANGGNSLAACAGASYCEDFEAGLDSMSTYGGGLLELTAEAHSGAFAVKASIGSVGDWARIEVPLPVGPTHFVRAWVRVEASALGASDRQALLVLHPADAASQRIGRDKVSLDWIGPAAFDLSNTRDLEMTIVGSGAAQVGQWHCVQVAVTGPDGQARASFRLDGQLVMESAPGIVPAGGFSWLMFGVEYAVSAAPLSVLFDDVIASGDERACE